jgi:hypothetical protein
MNLLPEKFASVLVTRVYLTDHRWLYQNHRSSLLTPTLKTLLHAAQTAVVRHVSSRTRC